MKKKYVLIMSVLLFVTILGGCGTDGSMNSSKSNNHNNSSTAFYENSSAADNTETDSGIEVSDLNASTDIDNQSDGMTFDTSAYQTMYVTGAAEIEVFPDAKGKNSAVGLLKYGDSVSLIKGVAGKDKEYGVSFIYSQTMESFGYIKNANLIELFDEVTYGEIYYAADDNTPFYSDRTCVNVSQNLSKNDMVAVLAKLSDGIWRVSTKTNSIGYVPYSLLSAERIEKKVVSSRPESAVSSYSVSSNVQSKPESKAESKYESALESTVESKVEIDAPIVSSPEVSVDTDTTSSAVSSLAPSQYVGEGEPPVDYTYYIVDVDIGYLSLRGSPSSDPANEIGKLLYGEAVYVIESDGEYWYVYSPSCGKYGFVKGDTGYLILPGYSYE